MHELSLCEGIRTILESEAEKQAFQSVKRVKLEIGVLSGVEADAMRFSFDMAMAGSIAEGAVLDIVETPGQAWCYDLQQAGSGDVRAMIPVLECAVRTSCQVTGGTEMKILELEVQ